MMKRTIGLFGLAILGVWFLTPGPIFAQDEPEPGQEDVQPDDDQEVDDVEGEDREADPNIRMNKRRARRMMDDPRHLSSQLNKLREVMDRKMDLSPQQEDNLDRLFEEHLERLKEQQREDVAKEAEAKEKKILELREELLAARRAEDRERVRAIREQLRAAMKERRTRSGGGTAQFLQQVRNELSEEQRTQFREILRRLKLDRYAGPREQPLSRLMRVVMDPRVGLSKEQRDKVRQMLRESLTADPDGDPRARFDQIAEEMKGRIFEELTDEQRSKVEALLEKDDRIGQGRGPGRRPHGRPGRGAARVHSVGGGEDSNGEEATPEPSKKGEPE